MVSSRTYMHWTASRAPKSAALVTSAKEALPTSGLRDTAVELPNIEGILTVNKTV